MSQPRLIGEIIAEIYADLKELEERYARDCRDEILNGREAARYLGVSPQTVSKYVREGRLHKFSDGVKYGIRKSELKLMKNPSKQ